MVHIIDLEFLGLKNSIASFLIEADSGPVLIETGPASTLPALWAGIRKAGYQPEDVKEVFITHIHLDHAGAAWWFAQNDAKIYLHPLGVSHLADPSRLLNSARRIYKDDMARLWGDFLPIESDRLVAVEDDEDIDLQNLKIKAHHTPGHAVHHIAWQIDRTLFTGDVAGVKINNGPVQAPCPPPDINLADWKDSILKIKSLNLNKFYLTHFGMVENIDDHLEQLNEAMENWAGWVKKNGKNETSIEMLTEDFKSYVRSQLIDSGVEEEEGLNQYEAANPGWMSVAGLLRYWKKKDEVKTNN
ncbi:MBL fold metallo-hydrolase [soil metagenome]